MQTKYGLLLFVVGASAVVTAAVSVLYPRTIGPFWTRSCMGRVWKRTFPEAPKDVIRQFLYVFVDAFAFPKERALQFAPADRVLAVYRSLYPVEGWPDALELETLALHLERHYAVDLRKLWRVKLTLGELFSRIRDARTRQFVMKNHFKVEAWVMWILAVIPIVAGFVAALIVPHLESWH
jgi:propanediol dehydratase small subunit